MILPSSPISSIAEIIELTCAVGDRDSYGIIGLNPFGITASEAKVSGTHVDPTSLILDSREPDGCDGACNHLLKKLILRNWQLYDTISNSAESLLGKLLYRKCYDAFSSAGAILFYE